MISAKKSIKTKFQKRFLVDNMLNNEDISRAVKCIKSIYAALFSCVNYSYIDISMCTKRRNI